MQPQQPMQGAQPMQGPMGQQQLDPAMVDAILRMQQNTQGRDQVQQQLRMADQMRADAKGQMQGTTAGRMYKAPNALNAVANIGQQFAGAQQQGAAQDAAQRMGAQEAQGSRDWFNAWLKSRGGGGAPGGMMPGQGGGGPGGMAY